MGRRRSGGWVNAGPSDRVWWPHTAVGWWLVASRGRREVAGGLSRRLAAAGGLSRRLAAAGSFGRSGAVVVGGAGWSGAGVGKQKRRNHDGCGAFAGPGGQIPSRGVHSAAPVGVG